MSTVTRTDQSPTPDLFVPKEQKPAVDIKGSVFTLTVLRIQSVDLAAIEAELKERIAQGPRFFENAPVVVDLEPLKDEATPLDFNGLVSGLRQLKLIPVGVRHATSAQQSSAVAAGLALMKGGSIRDLPLLTAEAGGATREPAATRKGTGGTTRPAESAAAEKDLVRSTNKTVAQPVRSGQQVYAAGGDLIVLAAVNAGAEIVADGNIHVYAPLRGRALAGVHGDKAARIFCQSLEAELVSVAGHYRVFEDDVPADLYRRPVQIYLNDKDQLTIEPIE